MEQRKVSLSDFIAGTEIRFESIHKPIYHRCLYKIDGKKYNAKICFENGIILVDNKIVKVAKKYE